MDGTFVPVTDAKFKPIRNKHDSAVELSECFFFLIKGNRLWLLWSFLLLLPALNLNVMVGAAGTTLQP